MNGIFCAVCPWCPTGHVIIAKFDYLLRSVFRSMRRKFSYTNPRFLLHEHLVLNSRLRHRSGFVLESMLYNRMRTKRICEKDFMKMMKKFIFIGNRCQLSVLFASGVYWQRKMV